MDDSTFELDDLNKLQAFNVILSDIAFASDAYEQRRTSDSAAELTQRVTRRSELSHPYAHGYSKPQCLFSGVFKICI